jgi:hypothetical protein
VKKRNHPANVVDVSSRIMGLLGRRKVDPTTEAMRTLKPDFVADTFVLTNEVIVPADVVVVGSGHEPKRCRLPKHLIVSTPERVNTWALSEWKQINQRIERQSPLTDDERQRWIDVLEKQLS